MTTLKKGLGRGLSSLIPQKRVIPTKESSIILKTLEIKKDETINSKTGILEISPNDVCANPYQPRKAFDHQQLEDLVNSIKEHGLLQPLVVSAKEEGKYELIAGERRLRACKILNLSKIPVIARQANDHQKLELALIENIQRQKLNPMEEAYAYKQLMDEFNFTQDDVAKKVGKSRPKVSNSIRLLTLPEEIIKAIEENIITEGHARAIVGLENDSDKLKLFKKVVQNKMNVREVEQHAKERISGVNNKVVKLDSLLESKQDVLRNALGTKVTIKPNGKAGKIIIDYYSQEELLEIVDVVSG